MTPVHMSASAGYRQTIRAIHLLPMFDRILVSLLYKIPFGTVSRIFSELENEKYIVREATHRFYPKTHQHRQIPTRREYVIREIYRNQDLRDHGLNYGSGPKRKSIIYWKTPRWRQFMERWEEFLSTKSSKKVSGKRRQN